MDAQTGIVILGVIQILCFLGIVGAGVALAVTGRNAKRRVAPTVARARRLQELGAQRATSARQKALAMVGQAKAVRRHVAQKWSTTRRLVHEAIHPQAHLAPEVVQQLDTGQRWTQRLLRLSSAARKAAGRDVPPRTRA